MGMIGEIMGAPSLLDPDWSNPLQKKGASTIETLRRRKTTPYSAPHRSNRKVLNNFRKPKKLNLIGGPGANQDYPQSCIGAVLRKSHRVMFSKFPKTSAQHKFARSHAEGR